jgi:hypothetical protein
MSQAHEGMVAALKEIVVTRLRERGFRGSFPHFRRKMIEQFDLLSFQFDKWGGGFVIEIAKCPAEGVTTSWGAHIPAERVKVTDLHPRHRLRLQPRLGSSTADWFRFDEQTLRIDSFLKTATEILPFLDLAEKWWLGEPDPYFEAVRQWLSGGKGNT